MKYYTYSSYTKNLLTIFTLIFPILIFASPPGMMHDMDDESMGQMMNERGYGYGYGSGDGYGGGYGVGRGMGMRQGYMMGGGMGGMMGPMMGPMGNMMGNLYGLNLDKKQREQIRDIQKNMRKQHINLMEKMMDTTDKLYELYDVDKPDADKIGQVYDEIYKIKRQMIQEHIQIRNQIYDILNKEQREKFKNNNPFAHQFGMMF